MITHFVQSVALSLPVLISNTVLAADINWAELQQGQTVRVTDVVDGDTVIIDPPIDNATEIRLVGIQAPKLPLGRKNFAPWPLGDEAKAALSSLVLDQMVTPYFGGRAMDRHGRILAHLLSGNSEWIQGRMLRSGMARVYSFPDNRSLVPEMLNLERRARAGSVGIWSHPFYAVRDPESIKAFPDRFELVEGTVNAVADVKGRVYLNFDKDWRTDFTISIEKRHRSLFEKSNINLTNLQGVAIRVRGWVRQRNGPMINITHPEQLEILTSPGSTTAP